MPVDLEWPRRAIVGAIVVIGMRKLASFAGRPGVLAAKGKTAKDDPAIQRRRQIAGAD